MLKVYLASASPRRRVLLEQIGIDHHVVPVDVDEAWQVDEGPEHYVERIARDKARAAWQRLGQPPKGLVLGADTALSLDGQVLGKPRDRDHGLSMLASLSGRAHRVLSAVAVVAADSEAVRVNVSEVTFRQTTEAQRRAYWDTGEPMDKAGAYAIQGMGAVFITHLQGSYSGVMGLPLYETAELLDEFGIGVFAGSSPTQITD